MAASGGDGGAGRPCVRVLHHVLPARTVGAPGVTVLWDAVAAADGRARVFFGAGTDPAAFAPDGAPGCALPQELRAISAGTMAVVRGAGALRLALAGGGAVAVEAMPDWTALLAGRDATLSLRLDETPAQVAEILAWHAATQAMTGAVILNRRPDPAFADALLAALGALPRDLTVVVADLPLPAGKPGEPAENHLVLTPDAPGRERMARPAPDPWRAPLASDILLELAKWRYLARARAVLALDAADVLPAPEPGAPTAFDRCAEAPRGVVLLAGRRIYPWRLRAGAEARIGDHTCRPFDRRRGIARWGAAPARAGLEGTWRAARVSHARPDPASVVPFLRAMAIRVPGHPPSALIAKTALVEDPALLAMAAALGHRPVRPPRSALRERPSDRTAIVTTMKNEGPFILEWIAYHRMIGVDDFLIYTNDCTDGTDALLDVLAARGIVQHRANPFRSMGLKPQHAALQAAEAEPAIRDAGWTICMDVDEFVNVRIGDGTLAALRGAMAAQGANMIALTWRLFGSADVHDFDDRPVLSQFTRCAPELIRKPHQAWGFKTLFRNLEIYRKLGVHRPKGLRPDLWDRVRWLNGSGRPMPREAFRNGWRSTLETFGYDWVQLNHYAVRSAESFLVKRDRGRVNHVDRDQGLNYWFRMNHNVDEDRSIQRMIPRLAAEIGRLTADPSIRAAHGDCVARHRAKVAALRADPAQAAFYVELTSARMERLCRMQPHFGSAVFAAGPGVVPDDLLDRDLPPGFQFGGDLLAAGE